MTPVISGAKTGAGDIDLTDLAEKDHASLDSVTAAQHHAKYSDAEALAAGLEYEDLATKTITGVTSEETLSTYNLPANALGSTGGLRIRCWGKGSGGWDATLRLKFGATTVLSFSTGVAAWCLDIIIKNTAINAQRCAGVFVYGSTPTPAILDAVTASEDTTGVVTVTTTLQPTNAGHTGYQYGFYMELLP